MATLFYVDVETTGLDSSRHEIIDLCIIKEIDGEVVAKMFTKVKPQKLVEADEEALRINNYSDEEWKNAPLKYSIAREVARFLKDGILVGHNVNFDRSFLVAFCEELNVHHKIPYACIDTAHLARATLLDYGVESVRLDVLREWFGWSMENSHTAVKDCYDCRRLYQILSKKTLWSWFKFLLIRLWRKL